MRLIVVGLIVIVANAAALLLLPPQWLERLGAAGYLGAFGATAIANATVIVPVPYYPLVMRLAEVLNPWGVAIAAAAGSVVGELTAFAVGRSGRQVVADTPFSVWVRMHLQRPWRAPLLLFVLSAPPSPFFDVAGLLAGALGVSVGVFVISTFLGRLVRMALIVFVWTGLS